MSSQPNRQELLARLGLRLPAGTLKRLRSAGIFCQPAVSVEYQHRDQSYVLRAIESGGAIRELGAYCGFVDADGNPLTWSERVDSLAVNGLHATVIAPALVRLEMVRNRLTYELLITRHSLSRVPLHNRPELQSSILFHGRTSATAVNNDPESPNKSCLSFYDRSGGTSAVPDQFRDSVQRLVAAVWCVGCRHYHLSQTVDMSSKGD
jgi:hypothetical protein